MEVTGILEDWRRVQVSKKEFVIWGHVYEDIHGRFRNGAFIHTSGIKNRAVKEGDIVQTRNSTYLLGKEFVDERTPEQKEEDARKTDEALEQFSKMGGFF